MLCLLFVMVQLNANFTISLQCLVRSVIGIKRLLGSSDRSTVDAIACLYFLLGHKERVTKFKCQRR